MSMKQSYIQQDSPDDHVFILIECPGRPAISIDVTNNHCRRGLAVRVNGMGIFNMLVDLKELQGKGELIFRYCSMCGEKLQLHSSRDHECKSE